MIKRVGAFHERIYTIVSRVLRYSGVMVQGWLGLESICFWGTCVMRKGILGIHRYIPYIQATH